MCCFQKEIRYRQARRAREDGKTYCTWPTFYFRTLVTRAKAWPREAARWCRLAGDREDACRIDWHHSTLPGYLFIYLLLESPGTAIGVERDLDCSQPTGRSSPKPDMGDHPSAQHLCGVGVAPVSTRTTPRRVRRVLHAWWRLHDKPRRGSRPFCHFNRISPYNPCEAL